MTDRQMPMPENPTWLDELQAALFPWFGAPEGRGPALDEADRSITNCCPELES